MLTFYLIGSISSSVVQILYDDEDTCQVSRGDIITARKYRELYGEYPPPLPERISDAFVVPMTLADLFKVRCEACVNCDKEDCGRCSSCVSTGSRNVCIQKVRNHGHM